MNIHLLLTFPFVLAPGKKLIKTCLRSSMTHNRPNQGCKTCGRTTVYGRREK